MLATLLAYGLTSTRSRASSWLATSGAPVRLYVGCGRPCRLVQWRAEAIADGAAVAAVVVVGRRWGMASAAIAPTVDSSAATAIAGRKPATKAAGVPRSP